MSNTVICPECGEPYGVGQWFKCPHGTPSYVAIGDEIPGGLVIENLGHEPMTFYSKKDILREATARGLEQRVRHVGVPGSDKSPYTTRWV